MIKRIIFLLFIFSSVFASAQTGPEMADALRENGKIYIVIGVMSLIFLAIVLFLVIIERKVKKIEDKLNNK